MTTNREAILALANKCGLLTYQPQPSRLEAFYHAARKDLEQEVERLKKQSANRLGGLCKAGESNDELRQQLAEEEAKAEHRESMYATLRNDIKDMQKQLAEKSAESDRRLDLMNTLDADCECLRKQLAEKDARIENLTSDRDAKTTRMWELGHECDKLEQQLAAAQAREQQYREAIVKAGIAWSIGEPYSRSYFEQALAQPSDTSALEACIKQAGEGMRERCAAESYHAWEYDSTAAIRDLPGVKLEDLQK